MKKLIILFILVLVGCSEPIKVKLEDESFPHLKNQKRFELYKTDNMWTFLLLDSHTGKVWRCQYSFKKPTKEEEAKGFSYEYCSPVDLNEKVSNNFVIPEFVHLMNKNYELDKAKEEIAQLNHLSSKFGNYRNYIMLERLDSSIHLFKTKEEMERWLSKRYRYDEESRKLESVIRGIKEIKEDYFREFEKERTTIETDHPAKVDR